MDAHGSAQYEFLHLLVQIYDLPAQRFFDNDFVGACIALMLMLLTFTVIFMMGWVAHYKVARRRAKKAAASNGAATGTVRTVQ